MCSCNRVLEPPVRLSLVLLVLGVSQLPPSSAFNLELSSPVIHVGPPGSMFGFSVAQHIDRNNGWLLIGAPEDQTDQPGVVRGGAVYRASTTPRRTILERIPFDQTGNNNDTNGFQLDEKSGQWLGATVRSAGVNGSVLACAPRYVWYTATRNKREPVGTCFLSTAGFDDFMEVCPCRNNYETGHNKHGFCQFGFGADVSDDNTWLFIGAVGSWYWQGRMFAYGQDAATVATREGDLSDDDSYLGYSVITGEFTGDDKPDIAVGMPRGSNLTGRVVLYTAALVNLHNITGTQLGAYFGYSLAVADVDGDKLDDIIIGAPMFSDEENSANWEIGRVYIAYQNKKHKFRRWDKLDGEVVRGRFGLALTTLGDINLDGYQDFAVSAPYDGNGVVFIHHGSALGVQKRPSQVIRDSDVSPGRPLPTFGFSISGGQDLDFNQYPDLLIGAYKASTAVYIRARPVVHVKAYLKFAPGTEYVDLDAKTCEDKSVEGTCVTLQLCVEYEGVGVANSIVLQTEYELDARKQKNPRLFFYDRQDLRSRSEPMALRRKEEQCRNITTYLKSSLRDKLTPIAATVNFQLFEKGRHCIDGLCPVLGPAGQLEDAIVIKKNCGPDNTCVPDLRVSHVLKEQTFLLGSGKNIEIDVTVANMGEDAYEAVAYLTLPPGVSFIKVERASDSADLPISCTPDRRTNILNCEIANPLPEYKQARFKILLQPQAERLQKQIEFELSVNSTNTELAGREDDNYGTIVIPIRVKTELLLSGTMEPETVTYNRSNFLTEGHEHETQIGPQIIHRYFIENKGPSTITEAEAIILWPSYAFSEDEPLLYLMEQPHTEGEGACQRVPNVNPMKIRLTTPTERRRALEGKNSFMTSPHQNLIPEEDEEDQKDTGRRLTRSADAQDTEQRNMNLEDYEREASDCGKSKNCTVIRCTAGPLRAGDRFAIALRSRLWINTLSQLGYGDVSISSKLLSRVTALPHGVDPSYLKYKTFTVKSIINPDISLEERPVPWWIYLLAALAGLLLLLLLIALLWKLGFFKRKRRPTAGKATGNGHSSLPEREPLNGYSFRQGDAAL